MKTYKKKKEIDEKKTVALGEEKMERGELKNHTNFSLLPYNPFLIGTKTQRSKTLEGSIKVLTKDRTVITMAGAPRDFL